MKVPKVSTSAPNVDRLPGTDRDIISCCFLVYLFCPCKCRFHCCCSCHIGLKPMLFASEPKFRVVASSECQSGFCVSLSIHFVLMCCHALCCSVPCRVVPWALLLPVRVLRDFTLHLFYKSIRVEI